MKRVRTNSDVGLEPSELSGLVDPLDDGSVEDAYQDSTSTRTSPASLIPPLSVVWAKVTGFRPAWSPGVVCYESEGYLMVYFLEGLKMASPDENKENGVTPSSSSLSSVLPKWYIEEQAMRVYLTEVPSSATYAWVLPECIEPWGVSSRHLGLIDQSERADAKRKPLLREAIRLADKIVQNPSEFMPAFIRKESASRVYSQQHALNTLASIAAVRDGIKLQHLKLFLEANMMELHWRTIAYARQFVRAVKDEIFGGYHLIATQDWPTDKDVESGAGDVFLVYPGSVLTESEAQQLEHGSREELHEDPNRYVAEIPNTKVILDKSGKHNVNHTRSNLYVDGLKYADPENPVWAPGPTVNHERTQYCKLAPHHVVGGGSIRGFWLQRKKGEIILKGEPLFWSYDCGAGKFDADFNLTEATPPPIGWISTESILKARQKPNKRSS